MPSRDKRFWLHVARMSRRERRPMSRKKRKAFMLICAASLGITISEYNRMEKE